MCVGAFFLPATVLGEGGGGKFEILSIPSQVQWQRFPAAGGEDGHVRSPNNNSNHATLASCVRVETGFPAPFNPRAAKSSHTPHSTTT